MCGIAGYLGPTPLKPSLCTATLRLMHNRGPDHAESKQWPVGHQYLSLLHTRLSIIDLDPRSHQPFIRDHLALIFNGEIYNYREVRDLLTQRGVKFTTSSDTEVLLKAYRAWGNQCTEHFEGMWAYALYDSQKNELHLSRDRFGEKPLYYLHDQNSLYFGSEPKFIEALQEKPLAVNEQQLLRYLVNGYKSLYKHQETFFQNLTEVPPATTLTINLENNSLKSQRYWTLKYNPQPISEKKAIADVHERLCQSLQLRLRADVPLAFCLSGGIDSASLVSLAVKEFGVRAATFSIIDSDERYNETPNIEATVQDLKCDHTKIILSPQLTTLNHLRELISYHDAPIATITYFIHSFLSQKIAQAGYKVALSGTAADELFTGYFDHWLWWLVEMQNHPQFSKSLADWQRYIKPIVRNPELQDPTHYFKNPSRRDHIYLNQSEFESMLVEPWHEPFREEKLSDSLLRNRMMNELFIEATRVILHEDDLNSMKYSLENRSPYLDRQLAEFAFTIPPEHLMKDGYAKHLLRQAVHGTLNDRVRLDRQKRGFNASIHSLIDFQDPATQAELLSDSPIYKLIRRDAIAALLQKRELPNSYSKFIFSFINAKIFLETRTTSRTISSASAQVQSAPAQSPAHPLR